MPEYSVWGILIAMKNTTAGSTRLAWFTRSIAALAFTTFAAISHAQTFTVLHQFNGPTEGQNPYGTPFVSNGIVYGTTAYGGLGGTYSNLGTVWTYTLNTDTFAVLYQFGYINGIGNARAGVTFEQTNDVLGPKLLGAAFSGGKYGNGVVFILQDNVLNTIASFTNDAFGPWNPPIIGKNGLLLGALSYGHNKLGGIYTVPPVVNSPKYSLVASFGNAFGNGPHSVIESGIGYYFTAAGVNIEQLQTGLLTTIANPANQYMYGGMATDGHGYLYGTTYGDSLGDVGTLFEVQPSTQNVILLHTFTGPDGANPAGNLLRDTNGNLFGTTTAGGANNAGTVFEYSAAGTFTTLYEFTGGDDGATPYAGLALDQAGNLYGTTVYGGTNGAGVLFRISGVD